MSTITHDVKQWLPLRLKTNGFIHTNEDKTPRPGMHVKQKGYAAGNGKLAGVIAKFELEDKLGTEIQVIGHGWSPPTPNKVFVWTGSDIDFANEWTQD